MSTIKHLNHFRRFVSGKLFSKAGKDSPPFIVKDPSQALKILIIRPNGRLGNLLLITPLLQEIENLFPNAQIDLFIKGGLAPILFQNYPSIKNYIKLPGKPFKELKNYMKVWTKIRTKKYDMVISTAYGSTSGKLAVKLANSKYKYYGLDDVDLLSKLQDYKHFGKYPVYNFRKYINQSDIREIPSLSIRLTDKEKSEGLRLLNTLVNPNKKTIGIYTFATGDKCLKEDWWLPFYELLLQNFEKEYNILEVLPKENVSQINFLAPTYYSTDIRELTAVLSSIDLFITADCGIMHLAATTSTPIVSLFSVTPIEKYAPYNSPKSEAIYVQNCEQTEIVDLIKESL